MLNMTFSLTDPFMVRAHGGRLKACSNLVMESGTAAINITALERSGLFKSKA
jgi:hypothetical protein